MNKTELVAAIAEQAEISKKDAEAALKAFADVVSTALKNGDRYSWLGLEHLRFLRERQERAEIPVPVRLCRSAPARAQSLNQVKH